MILSKKRYMYLSCKKDGIVSKKVGKKGVLLARRDNSQFVRGVYETVISKTFNKESRDSIVDYIIEQLNLLCSGSISYKNFVVTKSVGSVGDLTAEPFTDEKGKLKGMVGDYKVDLLPKEEAARLQAFEKAGVTNSKDYYMSVMPAQVQLAAKMGRRGQRVEPGTRLEYVITETGGVDAKQSEKIESTEYFLAHSDVLKIDYFYYMKQLINPLDEVLNVLFYNKDRTDFPENFMLKQYNYRLKVRGKLIKQIKDMTRPKIVLQE